MKVAYLNSFQGGDDGEGNIVIFYTLSNDKEIVIYHLNSQGRLEETWWDDEKKQVLVTWTSQKFECDRYGICGAFARCNSLNSPICICLRGFEPTSIHEWSGNNWTGGYARRTPLMCQKVNNKTTISTKEDGFLKLKMVKVPDFAEGIAVTPDICRRLCLENCSCVAYSHDTGIGCMYWTGNLFDIEQLESGGLDLYFRVAHTELGMLYVLFHKIFYTLFIYLILSL
jgi:hypothetical protein